MIESPHAEDWLLRGMHRPESPQSLGGSQLVVDLPAVMEMISLVTQGHVSGQQLQQALDVFARRFAPMDAPSGYPDRPSGYPETSNSYTDTMGGYADTATGYADTLSGYMYPPSGYPDPRTGGHATDDTIGDGCPNGCPVCAGARAEFDAIAAESLTHKVRLSDPEHYPYAAGKHTLHLSSCPKVARFVGRVEPVGSPFCLAGLPAFAHHGVFSTAWAAGMQVMTAEEAAEWVRRQGEGRESSGYKACAHCLPPVPGTEANADNSFDIGYWSTEDVVTWG